MLPTLPRATRAVGRLHYVGICRGILIFPDILPVPNALILAKQRLVQHVRM